MKIGGVWANKNAQREDHFCGLIFPGCQTAVLLLVVSDEKENPLLSIKAALRRKHSLQSCDLSYKECFEAAGAEKHSRCSVFTRIISFSSQKLLTHMMLFVKGQWVEHKRILLFSTLIGLW